jgi:UDP-glucose 4-epimerase
VGPRREGDPAELVANADKLKRTLRWTPGHSSLKEIVASAWEFQQSR